MALPDEGEGCTAAPCFRRIRSCRKRSALMLARTPAGYALKAAGTINQASRQANAEM